MSKSKKLKEITTKIGSGATPRGGQNVYKSEGISLIRSQNVLDFKFSYDGLAFIDEQQAKQLENVTVESGDILLNITGDSIARACIVPDNLLPARVNQHVSIIRCKREFSHHYIVYYLQYLKPYLLKLCKVGGTRNALTKEAIEKLNILIREDQFKIGKLLSALDAKIEVNNRINAELESLAKTIYDYWFVQFDFPNEDGKPYKASGGEMVYHPELKREIPTGWEVKNLGEVLTIVRGASPRPIDDFLSNKGLPWIKISDATASDNRFITETKQFIIKEGIAKTRHIKPNTLILSNSATPGLPRIVKIEAGVHDGWLIILNYTNGLNQEFMYHYFLFEYSRIICLGNGSIFKNLKTDYVKDLKIVLPPQNILNKASKKFKFISELIYNKTQENQQLTLLRDWLLPLLMNGQTTIK